MEIIFEKLRQIFEKLDELISRQKEMNSKVSEHEKWINRREGEIERSEGRLDLLEQTVKRHQSYIDQRMSGGCEGLKEIEKVQVEQAKWIAGQSALSLGWGEWVHRIGIYVAIAAALYGIWIKH